MTKAAPCLIALLVAGLASSSEANPAPEARPGRALFERAEANFNRGKFEEARADYQAAYDVEPLPAFLFNIGQCHRNLGDYERAQFFFQRYIVLDPGSPNRPAAEQLVDEMNRLADERRAHRPPVDLTTAARAPAGRDAPAEAATSPTPLLAARETKQPVVPPEKPIIDGPGSGFRSAGALLVGATAVGVALSGNDPQGTLPPIDTRTGLR